MEHDGTLHLVDACDGVTFLVCLGIAAADKHHTDGCTFIEYDVALVEIAFGYTFKQIDNVTLQAEHHTLSLGIAHAAVVFNDHRFSLHIDEAEEDESLIIDALSSKSLDGRANDVVFYLLHPVFSGKWYRSD